MLHISVIVVADPDVHDKLMSLKLPYSQLTKCPELKENPFRKRICKIFSSDGLGDLTFNEFMLLFSSLCEHSPRDIKLHYAFSIYDFDGDKYIGVADIEQVMKYSDFIYLFSDWTGSETANPGPTLRRGDGAGVEEGPGGDRHR